MKGKKVLKILVAAVMAVTFIAQVVAMADANYTTATTYNAASGKASVTTSVTGVNLGDEVTFLVKRSSDILYIDQTNSADGTASFSFLTPVANADSTATVEVGTSTSGKIRTALETDTITLSQSTVTYTVGEHGEVYVGEATTAAASGSSNKYPEETITFYFAPDTGYEFYSFTINGGEANTSIRGASSYTYTATAANATIAFAFIAKEASTGVVATVAAADAGTGSYAATVTGATADENSITDFATITNEQAAVEYGIVVSKTAASLDLANVDGLSSKISDASDAAAVYKFSAYGSYDGKFAVQLIDGGKGYLNGTVYSKTYVVSASGDCRFGELTTHTY